MLTSKRGKDYQQSVMLFGMSVRCNICGGPEMYSQTLSFFDDQIIMELEMAN